MKFGAIISIKLYIKYNLITSLSNDIILLNDEVPNTTQNYTFTNGRVSQVTHSRNSVIIRTDVFTYGTDTITEVRTLASGKSLTIQTNLSTLVTTVA